MSPREKNSCSLQNRPPCAVDISMILKTLSNKKAILGLKILKFKLRDVMNGKSISISGGFHVFHPRLRKRFKQVNLPTN